jgi:hypothetical protein
MAARQLRNDEELLDLRPAIRPQRCSCGHFAVTETTNSSETRRTGRPQSPVFRGISPVPAILFADLEFSRGDRGGRAWVRGIWRGVGGFVGGPAGTSTIAAPWRVRDQA